MDHIESPANSRIKHVRSLRLTKRRNQYGLFAVEGIRLIKEAMDCHAPIEALYYCSELVTSQLANDLLDTARQQDISCRSVSQRALVAMSERDGPQGIIAVVQQYETPLDEFSVDGNALLIIAHEIQDPGNLGTIIRTADAAGAAIILTGHSTDWYDPKAVRASMGSLFAVPRVRVPAIEHIVDWCRRHGVRTIASSAHAERSYTSPDYTSATAFIVGHEAAGLPKSVLESADLAVTIPMTGRADSLNVAVASALLLFEARRQRSLMQG